MTHFLKQPSARTVKEIINSKASQPTAIIIWTRSLSLTKTDLRSLDFVVNRFFMKLLNKTTDINVVETCQQYFSFRLPSDILQKRTKIFLDNITNN